MKVAIGLGNDFAFDVVGTEDGLLKLHISERHKWEAEALKRFPTALVVEDFTVRREIQAANLRQQYGKTNVRDACFIVTELNRDDGRPYFTSALSI